MGKELDTFRNYDAHTSEFGNTSRFVQKALQVATLAHEGQIRKSGEPYIIHPISVERILNLEWKIENEEMRAAALLHDVLEDTSTSLEEITNKFGIKVADLVSSQTNLEASTAGISTEEWNNIKDRENERKILAKSFLDPKVGVCKLADRLHNMRTLDAMSPKKQREIADETLRVYAPLAEALGMWLVKNELEDLSFYYLDTDFYSKVKREIDTDKRLSEQSMGFWESRLKMFLNEKNIDGEIQVKKTGYWSLLKKRRGQSVHGESSLSDFSDINDVVSYRLSLEREEDCYRTLGLVHKELGHLIDFDRDDIFMFANSRDNGYQALQTTLGTKDGDIEVAIMTKKMEEFNNWGVVSLIRSDEKDLSSYKLKLVFTPTEDVKFLKPEATGIDFAYKISENLGADASELLIDGKIFPITTVIPNASLVEVVAAKETRISPDKEFLNYSLPETRRVIDRQLIVSENQVTIADAKEFLNNVLMHKRGLLKFDDLDRSVKRHILNRFGVTDFDDLCLKYAGHNIDRLTEKIDEILESMGINKSDKNICTVSVGGVDTPGVLAEISSWILEYKGNIKKVVHETEANHYELRLVIEGIGLVGERFVKEKLENDKRFESWIIV